MARASLLNRCLEMGLCVTVIYVLTNRFLCTLMTLVLQRKLYSVESGGKMYRNGKQLRIWAIVAVACSEARLLSQHLSRGCTSTYCWDASSDTFTVTSKPAAVCLSLSLLLRPTVSRPVCFQMRHPSEAYDQFYYCQTVADLLMWGALSDDWLALDRSVIFGP
jgi:hypothetical protein